MPVIINLSVPAEFNNMKNLFLILLFAGMCFAQPGVPTNFKCTPPGTGIQSDTQMNLIWDRADDTDTSITVSRATSSGGSYTAFTALTAHSNVYLDFSPLPATTYYYKVHATNGGGSSADAGPINCTSSASQANGFTDATNLVITNNTPWMNTLTWTDSNSGARFWVVQRSTDGVNYTTVDPLIGATAASGFVDGGNSTSVTVTPNTAYTYRTRVQAAVSTYSNWVYGTVTTAVQGSGANVPTGLTMTVNSATSTTLNWTDTNSAALPYCVETSAFNNMAPSFSNLTTTANGVTTYAMTTVAETFYYIRLRSGTGAGCVTNPSGYTIVLKLRTPSPTVGGGSNAYTVCPSGCTATTIGGLSPSIATGLGPGDSVTIGCGGGSPNCVYNEGFLLSNRGTAALPITITCAGGATIDGTNAVYASASQFSSPQFSTDLALILVARRNSQTSSGGWSPGFISINGCQIQNATIGGTYTYAGGGSHTYGHTACIYTFEADNVQYAGNTIHGCSNGIFGAGQNDTRNVEVMQIGVCPNGNSIYGNGEVGTSLYHDIYFEGINVIYECNKFGDLIAGTGSAATAGVKDRSAGSIVRYNRMVMNSHQELQLNFGGAQNYDQFTVVNPLFNKIEVYGNSFEDTTGTGVSSSPTPWEYGEISMSSRNGPFLIYDNNWTIQSNRSSTYHYSLFFGQAPYQVIDFRNNVIWNGATSGNTAAHIYLMPYQLGYIVHSGSNWISSVGYFVCNEFQAQCLNGTQASILGGGSGIVNNGATNNPGFQIVPTINPYNLALATGGQVIGLGGVLGTNWDTVTKQYVEPISSATRSNISDLGWQKYASGGTVPTFLTTSPLTSGVQNVAYSNTLSFSGDVPLTSCTLSSGTLPTGITWALSSGNCVLSGTPTNSGTFTPHLQAANATGNASNGPFTYSLTIAASPIAPTITYPSLATCPLTPGATQNVAYTTTFTATGSPVTSWTIASGSAPTGITLGAGTGIFGGTPTVPGLFTFAIQAANAAGNSINGPIACSINVAAVSGATAAPASR